MALKTLQAKRLANIPPYAFAEIDKAKRAAIAAGVDVIPLTIGDPDLPTPAYVVDELVRAAADPSTHRYPEYEGSEEFRSAVSAYYAERFGVKIDPKEEVMALIGSKEGIAHMIWAIVDPGDVVLIPDPAYPVYRMHTLMCGGEVYSMPLTEASGYLPDFGSIPENVLKKTKMMFLNYPNNPTGAVCDIEFFREAVSLARHYGFLICHDAAYVEMAYDEVKAPSILEVPGSKEVAVEFYSLSKPFNMTGWRIAAAVGQREAISALGIVKTNTDSGQFTAIQRAGAKALLHTPRDFIDFMNKVYTERRDILIEGLAAAGWHVPKPKGTFYAWAKVPRPMSSAQFALDLLEKTGVMVTPGSVWGVEGEGYVRLTFTLQTERIRQAVSRISDYLSEAGIRA
ncbi:MAG TPA: LL-diaminopimelate aminotransferase [Clostridia bacterium]|nr:LL-diaminopimelate aminotransferase [Clostridia bacterium]